MNVNDMSMAKSLNDLYKSRKKKAWRSKLSPGTHYWKERNDWPKEISNNIKVFYETLFKQNSSKTNVGKQEFLDSLDTKTLTNQ